MRKHFLQTVRFKNKTFLVMAFTAFGTAEISAQCMVPSRPGSITTIGGTAKVCPGTTKSYSITAVAGATSYLWTPPAGANITVGQGTLSAIVNYTAGFTANDSIKVAAVNACGAGSNRTLLISRNNPPLTGTFTGPAIGFCGRTGVAYSVPNIANVVFNWTLFNAPGTTITSGLGTHAITVDFTQAYKMGILGVSTSNACGTSGEHHLHLKASPAAPLAINGPASICANQQGVSYSIAPVPSATAYTWIGTPGSRISDGVHTSTGNSLTTTATSVTVNYGTSGGTLKVRGINACGNGTLKSVSISVNCRAGLGNAINNEKVFCYPVPANNELNVSFAADHTQALSIQLFDLAGKSLSAETFEALNGENIFTLDVSSYPSGIYMLKVIEDNKTTIQKVTIR